MKLNGSTLRCGVSAVIALTALTANSQIQTTGEPGSPSATTTISGKQLPAPDPKFGGVINQNATCRSAKGRA